MNNFIVVLMLSLFGCFISLGAVAQTQPTKQDYQKALVQHDKLLAAQEEDDEIARSVKLAADEKAETLEMLANSLKGNGYNPSEFIRPDTYENGKEIFCNEAYGDSIGHLWGKFYAVYYVTNGPIICEFWTLKLKNSTSYEIGNDDISCIPSAK